MLDKTNVLLAKSACQTVPLLSCLKEARQSYHGFTCVDFGLR